MYNNDTWIQMFIVWINDKNNSTLYIKSTKNTSKMKRNLQQQKEKCRMTSFSGIYV